MNTIAKKKYYLILDTETATLPFAKTLCKNEEEKKRVCIARPLVYDIGWTIMERNGNIVKRENYLVQETFFVPNVFNTAYYCDKRPLYMQALKEGQIKAATWNEIAEKLLFDLKAVDLISAYNAAFDFKKAIPFTEEYISALYSEGYNDWEKRQYGVCKAIASGRKWDGENPEFLEPVFKFRGEEFPIADLWNVACTTLINIDKYRNYCLENELLTNSAMYFKTSAETAFQYLSKKYDFQEAHTALSDAEIESEILAKALKKGAVHPQMASFPFRNLGTTVKYVKNKKPKYTENVVKALRDYIIANDGLARMLDGNAYWTRIIRVYDDLQEGQQPLRKGE